MQLLPDSLFSTEAGGDEELQVLASGSGAPTTAKFTAALTLPPTIMIKWLRADCCTTLDLSSPGSAWSLQVWQGVAGCLHAVPSLQALRVTLPRYKKPKLPDAAVNPLQHRFCSRCDPTCSGSSILGGGLHFHCSRCKCAPTSPPRCRSYAWAPYAWADSRLRHATSALHVNASTFTLCVQEPRVRKPAAWSSWA